MWEEQSSRCCIVFGAPFDVAPAGQHSFDFAAMSGNHHTEQHESIERSAQEAWDNITLACFHGGLSSEISAHRHPFFHQGDEQSSRCCIVFGAPFDVAPAGQHSFDFAAMSGNHHTEQHESIERSAQEAWDNMYLQSRGFPVHLKSVQIEADCP